MNLIYFCSASPIQIALSAYFMYQELGAAMFAGMAVLVLAIPLNAAVTGISRRFQVEQMKNKDERVMLMNEILGGIKVLKLYAWEKSFIKQILDIRLREIVVLKKAAWMRAMFNFVWNNVPFMMSLACFTTYIFMDGGNVLTAQKAFVTMSYINLIKIPMMFIPFLIIGAIQVSVSISRLNKFMNGGELDLMTINKLPMDKDEPISVEEATFRWADDDPVVLRDIDFKVKRGSLTAVVGPVGSGKSSLIGALLGELEKDSGRVNVSGSVAYVPQQAWMQNASVQDNILFGTEFSQMTYLKAIDACALKTDLEILPGGDQTEIGEKGINLSGGQKQRVSLARAVYNDADIYLLDDPLSAVDSHVGKHIFEEVIGSRGALRNKTTILVTHGITYLPKTDHIIVMKDGRISEQGSYRELVERKGDFAAFLIEHMAEAGISEDDHEIKAQLEETMGEEFRRELDRQRSRKASVGSSVISDTEDEATDKEYEKEGAAQPAVLQHNGNAEKGARLIEKETAETGSVKNDVYMHYVKSVGMKSALIAFAMQAISTVFFVLTNLWLDVWTGEGKGSSEDPEIRNLYLGVYGGLGAASGLAMLVLAIIIAVITLNGSLIMHQDMLKRILHCPMSFFDTTPLGRIVNRFAKDVDVCDNTLPAIIQNWLNILFQALATMVLIVTPIPYFLAVLVPIGVIFLIVQKIFIAASRQLKRLESISRSPIYSHFGETLQGASTIKAYGMEHRFIMDNELKVDTNQAAYFPGLHLNRWLAIRLEGLGALVTFGSAIFILLFPESVDPSDVGLVITYSLSITQLFNWLVRMASDLETNIVAVERIKEYSTSIESEAEWETSHRPKDSWPEHGSLEFIDFAMRYRPGLDLVLKGVKCQIKGGETVGIVGRTGAGKSSLTVALFRLVESASGSIVIDGEDISKMGLHDLRKKLTIIPQDPVLFSGSLRMNLDPFEEHSDEALWHALELSHLKEFVSGLENGLDYEISEAGENVSVGQRQLVCLARALLRKTKVLILDEATAAVDLETDDLIQSTIRKEFKGCTVLTIAHRLNTILDYNRIMVLDKGVIVEFDSPDKLLVDETTIFHSMAKNANLV
jgi:ATP-binding cassette subfamily C (CFTR/MRP) protein 1